MKKLLKRIYDIIPFKKPVFLLLRSMWRPQHRIYKHLHFKGTIKVNTDDRHSFKMMHHGFEIENSLFWEGLQGGWEKISVDLWKKLSAEATIVFDIGANTGVYSLISACINPQCKVHAFEPVSRVYHKLVNNVNMNAFNVKCNELAVSDLTGKAVIYDTMGEHILSVTVNKNLQEDGKDVIPVEINTITLEKYIRENHIPGIDLMKLDVETHEPEALEGMGKYLELFKPTLLIEILNDEVGSKVEKIIQNFSYLYFNIDEDKGIRKVDSIRTSDHFNYLLCQKDVAMKLSLI